MTDADSVAHSIVIDNGSGTCKVGFAGHERPDVTFPSIVGYMQHQAVAPSSTYIGHEAQSKREILSLLYPIEHGVVTRWEDMERIWRHAIENELRVATADHPVMLTEAPLNPKAHRERLAEIMFENLNVPSLHITNQAPLSCYASGRVTGVVLDSGDGVTHAVPVYDGSPIPHAILRVDFAGRDLTNVLVDKLGERDYRFITSADKEIVREMKEKLCFVALDFEGELHTNAQTRTSEKSYELPDGRSITLGDESFSVPESLFQPALYGLKHPGLHETVHSAIVQCDADVQPDLYAGVVLAGGSTMFPGMTDRMSREMNMLSPPGIEAKVAALPKGQDSVWTGGSILASSANFSAQWCLKQEFEEVGPSVVYRHGYI
ncbi:hypothetical protein ONZ45_g9552 [Pleurotus djamor]|nr:hypothetical protein ONZ45_g9552 [Pleurotus djamor]